MSRSVRRLMKEASELSASPSPHFHAAPVSDSNLYDWHFTLAGPPPPSPYAGGIYHGRIVLPPTYPLRPPSFRFLTPSGRFEVNREICLSISGHHEETWQPAWGIRTALLAIRSFMEGDARGHVGGLEGVSDEIRRQWAGMSREWCCEGCGGRSNEVILREWRAFCAEQGVDVEREEEVEGVPEELRIGVGKKKEGEDSAGTDDAGAGEDGTASRNLNPTSAEQTTSVAGEKSTSMSTSAPSGPLSSPPAVPSFTTTTQALAPRTAPTPGQTPTQAPTSQAVTQRLHPTPTRPAVQPAPVPSQDSPWLDRAIFGVLVALILMILRRFINIEE
ncbi:ubiquitin-conjugating enzyme/RWD-like protein [Aspergillus multicolor]|uniref:ubiquitin-conjugating enzyme/RWD-like protein n=1 Tax=Aspergillus multicolor TaxID=41759 RepID=UPI003CCCAA96